MSGPPAGPGCGSLVRSMRTSRCADSARKTRLATWPTRCQTQLKTWSLATATATAT